MALFIRDIGNKAFNYFLLSVGWLYYLVILKFVSLTDIEFQNEVSLTIYAIICFLVAHFLRVKSPIPKEMVDVVYYTVGMLGILLFLWSQADSERRFPFKLDITLSDAITENSDEIEAAKEFSRMFYDESDFLISVVNRYLSEAPSRNVEASCVHDFSLYESMHVGLVNIDKSAILIRSSVGLKSDAPEKVISRCSAMFGGKRFRDNLIFSFFPRENNVIESSHFPFDSIESVEVLERELYLFLPMRLPESEMRVSEYVEYLLDDEGKILNIDELEFISEIDRDYVRIPLNQPWIDSYVVAARRVFGANFENTIWPFIAIYLFALKIASGSRSRK